jgi:hypothetical protein
LSEEEQRSQTLPLVRDENEYYIAVCGAVRGKDMLMPTACPPFSAVLRPDWIAG